MASKLLEKELEEQQAQENAIVKLLVLGTGESGKSTVFKQMKILYSVPDPPAKFIMICRANLFGNAHAVMDGMQKLKIEFKSDDGKAAAEALRKVPADGNPSDGTPLTSYVKFLKDMFADAGCVEAIERAAEYQLNDSTIYFWERAEAICSPDYAPTEQDVLRARVRTTGIVQQNFQIGEKKYTMFDVGGQRNERRKWIHCFDNVTAVIFVTAISEYDQVLYEDENTNRMDEALVLFDQICNHPSFKKTSMILFLNKRDLFEKKLGKKDLTCWEDTEDTRRVGQNYDECIKYIKQRFLDKNKDKLVRQVYVHATCATDTSNISFVMESVFDIILKDNLRKLQKADITKLVDMSSGTGVSGVVTGPKTWAPCKAKVMLCCAWFSDTLKERNVMVDDNLDLPAVKISEDVSIQNTDWAWVMGLGKNLPTLPVYEKETGSFKGNFKEGAEKLRAIMAIPDDGTLGSVYDFQIVMEKDGNATILIVCVKMLPSLSPPAGFKAVVHEEFENAHYAKYDGLYDASKVKAPAKNEEFNPFAPNPVGFRWFKGVTLFTKEVNKAPDKGVYLGVFKVLSSTDGFKIMVNEHNRITIPMIFLTENQLDGDEKKWMHGVRIREEAYKIDLLEGKQPNRGWLGPEMSGEEGATFPEKLWWAIDEAKARLDTDDMGKLYDTELLAIDEDNKIQLLLFGKLADNEADVLPGHIWVTRDNLEVQNMKYNCASVQQSLIKEMQEKISAYQTIAQTDAGDLENAKKLREEKGKLAEEIEKLFNQQEPLKWVNRVIMWCADKMPSIMAKVEKGEKDKDAYIEECLAQLSEVEAVAQRRNELINVYKK